MTKVDRRKYIVFKREEYERNTPTELDDAVVIRTKDRFAASALYTYATGVQNAIEILEEVDGIVAQDHLEFLRDLADYFWAMAEEAHQVSGKFPD